jgi:peptidase M50B-like protein
MVSSRRALVIAVVAAWLLEHVVPFGRLVLYPFTLLATWVHESGHGLAALVTGGSFARLAIFWDASGVAVTSEAPGWPVAITCLGGLLAPPLVGAGLLVFVRGPRRARVALALVAGGLAITLALWVRSTAGLVVMPICAALAGLAAWRWSERRRLLLAQFIAVTLALDTVGRLFSYAFATTARVGGVEQRSDVAQIADAVGGPPLVWGLAVVVVAAALLALGIWLAWRPPGRHR